MTTEVLRNMIYAGSPALAGLRWVILDEVNVDVLERSFSFEDRTPLGRFSPGFTRQVQSALREARRAARLGIVGRG